MKVRIRFSESGALVYIGHLDVMRYFQKLFRRANIPVAYSEGFSPHQILSFTPPLPLGMESTGEYADVELTKPVVTKEALSALALQSVPEIEILSFKELPPKCESAMASVAAARYSVGSNTGDDITKLAGFISSFKVSDEVRIVKKTKKNEKEVNIRPLVYELCYVKESNELEMLISSGSTDNIKPEYVVEGLLSIADESICYNELIFKRIDQYARIDGKLVSLDEIGCDIL